MYFPDGITQSPNFIYDKQYLIMPTPEEITQICTEVNEFKTALQKQQAICGELEQHPELILFSLISTTKRQNNNQKYAALCALWVAMVVMVVTVLLFSSNFTNLLIAIVAMFLALIPVYIASGKM